MHHIRNTVARNGMIFGMVDRVLGGDTGTCSNATKLAICNQAIQVYESSGGDMEQVQKHIASQIPLPSTAPSSNISTELNLDDEESDEESGEESDAGRRDELDVFGECTFFGSSHRKKKKALAKKALAKKASANKAPAKKEEDKKNVDNGQPKESEYEYEQRAKKVYFDLDEADLKSKKEKEVEGWIKRYKIDEDILYLTKPHILYMIKECYKQICFANLSPEERSQFRFDEDLLPKELSWAALSVSQKITWFLEQAKPMATFTGSDASSGEMDAVKSRMTMFFRIHGFASVQVDVDMKDIYYNLLEIMKNMHIPLSKKLIGGKKLACLLSRKYTKFSPEGFARLKVLRDGEEQTNVEQPVFETIESWKHKTWREKILWVIENESIMKYCLLETYDEVVIAHRYAGQMWFKPYGYELDDDYQQWHERRRHINWSTGKNDYKRVRRLQKAMMKKRMQIRLVSEDVWTQMNPDMKVEYILDKKHWMPAKISNLDEVDAKFLGTL